MKKFLTIIFILTMIFALSGCALLELLEDKENIVDLGNGDESVRWNLVHNNNAYSTVESAYFEFNKDSFKYYEDGENRGPTTHVYVTDTAFGMFDDWTGAIIEFPL